MTLRSATGLSIQPGSIGSHIRDVIPHRKQNIKIENFELKLQAAAAWVQSHRLNFHYQKCAIN